MYTLVLFDEESQLVIDCVTVPDRPVVEGNNFTAQSESRTGINVAFVVIEGERSLKTGDSAADLLPLDIKNQLTSDNDQLKTDLTQTQQDLAQTQQVLNDIMLGGL